MKNLAIIAVFILSLLIFSTAYADEDSKENSDKKDEINNKYLRSDLKFILDSEKNFYLEHRYYFTKKQWEVYFKTDNYFDTSKVPTVPYYKKEVEKIVCPEQDFIRKNLHSKLAVKMLEKLIENTDDFMIDIYLPELTPEIAQVLVDADMFLDFWVLQKLNADSAKILSKTANNLTFHALQQISPEVAKEFAKCTEGMRFAKVKSISLETATALGEHEGDLDLWGLRDLSPACAKALERHIGRIWLPDLMRINQATAKMLVDVNNKKDFGSIGLDCVTEISPEVAAEFARFKGIISISGENILTYEVALNLSKFKGEGLFLNQKTLTPKIASGLAGFTSYLLLHDLESLNIETAAELAKMRGTLMLPVEILKNDKIVDEFIKAKTNVDLSSVETLTPKLIQLVAVSTVEHLNLTQLTEITVESAEILAQHKGLLYLSRVKKLSDKVAKILQKHEGSVFLPNLVEINPETARLLLKIDKVDALSFISDFFDSSFDLSKGFNEDLGLLINNAPFISLNKITKITPEVAEILGQYGHILAIGITEISSEVASNLVRNPKMLVLNKIKKLSIEAATKLSQGDAIINLGGLEKFTSELAGVLAKCKSALFLPAVKTLTVEEAEELAKTKTLTLDGITELKPEIVRAFAKHPNMVSFNGVTEISPELAEEVIKYEGVIRFGGVEKISEEVAKILAKSKGMILAQDEVLILIDKYRNYSESGEEKR